MAIFEELGRMTYISKDGDEYILYPVTKKECVYGLAELEKAIGSVDLLHTIDKSNLVSAINEIVTDLPDDDDIRTIVENSINEAKESGEFDGRGVVSISRTAGDGTAGSVDTYTITYTDGGTTSFDVYNGADGKTTGADVYMQNDEPVDATVGSLWYDTDEFSETTHPTAIPTFDLHEMGLPTILQTGVVVYADVDCEHIRKAMSAGPVKFIVESAVETTGNVSFIVNGVYIPSWDLWTGATMATKVSFNRDDYNVISSKMYQCCVYVFDNTIEACLLELKW